MTIPSTEEMERKKLCLEIKKLEWEIARYEEEIISLQVKRKALIATIAFTGVGLWIQLLKFIFKV